MMNIENKLISNRQSFRMGILENITLGMVVIPYATLNLAGRWHFLSLIIGLILGALYMGLIYYLSEKLSPADRSVEGLFTGIKGDEKESSFDSQSAGAYGIAVSLLYALRYTLRAGLIMFFFAKTVQEFLLQSFNLWVIIIAFLIVCGYGASKNIEDRGRMLELLFPWMIVPIILVAVFSITNISLTNIYDGIMGIGYESIHEAAGIKDVLLGAYVAFLITTSTELSLFSLPRLRERNWRNPLKTGLWIIISILLAYVFIIGILGGHWVAKDPQASLNVMEAAFVPGDVVERADYPVLIFWIIGVFAVVSGYMFFAKEAGLSLLRRRNKRNRRIGVVIVMAVVLGFTFLWSLKVPSIYLSRYMLWADVAISLLIPVAAILRHRVNVAAITGKAKRAGMLLITCAIMGSICGCSVEYTSGGFEPITRQQESIEKRDYVTDITFQGEQDIVFTVADIKKYISDGTGSFDTKEETLKGDSLQAVMESYYQEKGKQPDVGHLSTITFRDIDEERIKSYVMEMSDMVHMGKSVTVIIELSLPANNQNEGGNTEKDSIEKAEKKKIEISLRQLIKKVYAGENFL
ncbi:MAG: GerAB/ArcD/ProY family transporter [Lachnospiraceae bacterium]|nr:GerAB/ArcD/ProY family transporter [Lachnospiraceae bacterium]